MERGIRKVLSFVVGEIASKAFGKIILNPCNFEKTQVPLEFPRFYQFSILINNFFVLEASVN